LKQWLKAAGIEHTTSQGIPSMLDHFFSFELPATNPMLPKLMVLLQRCLASGLKSNQLYFSVQKIIQNHYRALGNSIFFGNAEEIFSGKLDYSMEDVNLKIEKMKLMYLN